jgi:riboflavin transporter FmnP
MYPQRTTIKVAGIAVLAPLSVVIQIFPPLFYVPWGMRIDLVAVPWILCWILFGLKPALACILISAPLVGVLGPFAGGFPGAVMKSVASVWMFAIPAVFTWKKWTLNNFLKRRKLYATSGVLAIIVRDIVCVVFNLYFALPVFFGISPQMVIELFSPSFFGRSLGLVGLGAYIAEVAFWNSIQGIIDIYVSLIIALIILKRVPQLSD